MKVLLFLQEDRPLMRYHLYIKNFIDLARGRSKAGQLSVARQCAELIILYCWKGVGPQFYQMAGFWNRNVAWRHKVGYLTSREYKHTIDDLNPLEYRKLSQNKVAEKALLRHSNIPSPAYLGWFGPRGHTVFDSPLTTPQELSTFLRFLGAKRKVCFKPVEGWGGVGVEVVEVRREHDDDVQLLRGIDGRLMSVPAFCTDVLGSREMIVEEYLLQHPDFARFNPSSVNTLRIWTLLAPAEKVPSTPVVYLRIGRMYSLVDNQSMGGIVAPVDLQTGALGAAHDGRPTRATFSIHPDHGSQIEGMILPYFKESLQLARQALLAFPKLRFAGIDMAVTPGGPQVLELNISPDREGAAFVGTPTKLIFAPCRPRNRQR